MIEFLFSDIPLDILAFIIGVLCGMIFEFMIVFITGWIDEKEAQ